MPFSNGSSQGMIRLATFLAAALAPPASAAQTAPGAPAKAAFEECRVLLGRDAYRQAIARCEDAVRLDPNLPDPYFMLGAAHWALWQQERASTTPDDARIQGHRRQAAESYKKFLAVNPGDTDARRRARPVALTQLLGLYISGDEKEDAVLPYANLLAQEPSLDRRALLILAGVYSRHERPDLSEKQLLRQLEADPSDVETCEGLAQLYDEPVWKGQRRFDDSVAMLERCAAQNPGDPGGYYRLAMHLWDKAYRDPALTSAQKLVYVERGLAHADRAMALKQDFFEAMVYKGLLLRVKATAVVDPALRQRLIDEATALQKRALALKAGGVLPYPGLAGGTPPEPRVGAAGGVEGGVAGGGVGGVVGGRPEAPRSSRAVRVGGEIKEPRKLKDVPPEYPAVAKQSRVQGQVILECTIDAEGNVVDVRVLRSVPLLDEAAIAAVKQWVYAPTLLDGVPVPVIMTVTLNFSLS